MRIKKIIISLMIITSLSVMMAGCNKGSAKQAEDAMDQTTEQTEGNAEK